MIQTLIFITGLFGFLAALCGFLFAASFTRGQRERFPVLRKLDGKQVYFAIGVVLFLVLFYGASTWKSILTTQPLFETVLGPAGEPIEKATLSGFEQELEQGATELKQQAEDFFNAAERDFEKWRYADAADNYQKSSGLIPTMSAYLNLGLSLWYVSDFARAQEAFSSGLRIALKKQDRKLEATFRGNIGIVYRNQGRLEEALRSHQTALHISEEIDNLLGQANTRNNIGYVYANQGKLEEALKSHRDALAIYKEIGNPRSQATALTGIGLVYRLYRNQGKLEEALKF
ncbi:tetratricopeptide repeat protein, partial [candidate division KSB1 bacterium]|nr:tetratricopeptide repeat protein [candidate division KSB1 bacterium]